jgi:hypothetical protein
LELGCDLSVTRRQCDVGRGSALIVSDRRIGAVSKKQPEKIGVAILGGCHQRSEATGLTLIDCGAGIEQ